MTAMKPSKSVCTPEDDKKFAEMEERARRRMISNRDSARRARMKKQMLIQNLTGEISKLQKENSGIVAKIDEATDSYRVFAAQNIVLRAQATELSERLRYLDAVIKRNQPISTAYSRVFQY